MSESAYDILARVLRDSDAEIEREKACERGGDYVEDRQGTYQDGYVDALMSARARIQAAMYGLPRTKQPEYRGKPPDPLPTSPPGAGRIIDAEYSTVSDGEGRVWTMPKNIPSP